MSSKSPKTELVSKNSLPKTPAQLKAESSSSVVAASSTSTTTTMKSSTAVSSNLMAKIQADQVISSSIGANGFSEGSNFYDSLSLKQLNDLLLFYIQRVHEMEKDLGGGSSSQEITVKIDRTEIKNLDSTYNGQINDLKKSLADKDKIIAELKAKIDFLEREIEKLKDSLSNKEKVIIEKEKTIGDLTSELAKLNAELASLKSQLASTNAGFENSKKLLEKEIMQLQDERNQLGVKLTEITSKFTSERNRNYDLTAKLESLERDLWFKIKLLTSELEVEREKSQSRTQIDVTAMDEKFKGEYGLRLQEELKLLREYYKQEMEKNRIRLEKSFEDKTAQFMLDREEVFKAEINSKDKQIAYLTRQNEEYRKMNEEIVKKYSFDETEIRIYNSLIAPEVDRMRSISMHMNTSRNGFDSDAEVDGSTTDEEQSSKKSVKKEVKVVKETVQSKMATSSSTMKMD